MILGLLFCSAKAVIVATEVQHANVLRHIRTIGCKGTEIGQFNAPCHLSVLSSGSLCVVEGQNHRIQLLDADAKPLRTIDGLKAPTGVAVSHDTIFVAESTGSHSISARCDPISRLADSSKVQL